MTAGALQGETISQISKIFQQFSNIFKAHFALYTIVRNLIAAYLRGIGEVSVIIGSAPFISHAFC